MRGSWNPNDFPDLKESEYVVRSRRSLRYNCIAWAADDNSRWWWPDPMGVGAWPRGVAREESLAAFQHAFAALGYRPCGLDISLEEGFEKVAIFVDLGSPTHAAWQRPDGTWSSKMGQCEDIDHRRLDLFSGAPGKAYGGVRAIMKRRRHPRAHK